MPSPHPSSILPTYARSTLVFERGEGAWLETTDGRRVLDFGAGIAVNALGHAHPHLVEALTSQAQKLWHISNLYQNPDGERLAKRHGSPTLAAMRAAGEDGKAVAHALRMGILPTGFAAAAP